MSIGRRRLLAVPALAAAGLVVGAGQAAAAGYQHLKGKREIPAGRWVTINEVAAVRTGPAVYVMQFALETQRATLLRVRFNRNGRDGTGDQTYRLEPGTVWNTTHVHAVGAGFGGRMLAQIMVDRPVVARYRIMKALKP